MFVIQSRQRSVGWIQWYRWSDYPDHARKLGAGPDSAGIDLAIGDAGMLGIGLGPAAIQAFVNQCIFNDPAIDTVVVDPEERNIRSVRAFTKAGFRLAGAVQLEGEPFSRSVMALTRSAGA